MKTFDEVVDKEFLEKYGWRISDDFGAVDENGKLNMEAIRSVFRAYDGANKPNQFTYVLIHGLNSPISSWNVPGDFKGKEDELYAVCLKRDKTWQELIGKPKNKKGILL